ncbi:hypothetical protein Goshw_010993 [Gossypium schwendimanii]|uniref:RNase H type-1 domain-containing protein n=1 Tax=Gossypium schwendimanii TaxID=34291 RepID=A0A7J9MNJ4_GOSSC|nr:hypothetical protein [Gossypium schwendimanii]
MRDETIIHAFRDRPKACAVLSFGGLDGHLLDPAFERCIDWLEDASRLLDLKAFENFITVLCNICSSLNNALFQGKEEDTRLIWEREQTLGDDFRIFNLSHVAMNPRPRRSHKWVKPPIDVIRINVDATIHDIVVGIRIITSDSDGFVLGGLVVYLDYKLDIQWAEVEALREGIVWARNNNVARAIFETDYAVLVNRFKFCIEDISIYGFRLKNIFDLLDSSSKSMVEWVACSSNRVVDGLCKLAIDECCTFSFNMEYSSDIHGLVVADAC